MPRVYSFIRINIVIIVVVPSPVGHQRCVRTETTRLYADDTPAGRIRSKH